MKEYEKAEVHFEKAYKLKPDFKEGLIKYANFLLKVKRLDKTLKLIENLKEALDKLTPFEIEIDELLTLPSPKHPRVLALNIKKNKALDELAQKIENVVVKAGYETQTRPFTGHLTIARNKSAKRLSLDAVNLKKTTLGINTITLFKSDTRAEGAVYTAIERIRAKRH